VGNNQADTVSQGLGVEKFSSLEVEQNLQTPLLRERIEHLTQSDKSVLGEGLSRREQYDNCPLTLALSRKAREILLFRNNFPLSIFNFPFIQKENRRVCHTALDAVSQGLGVEKFSSLEVEEKLQTYPLLRGEVAVVRAERATNAGEVSTCWVCHTVHDTVSHGFEVEQLRSWEEVTVSYRTRCGIARSWNARLVCPCDCGSWYLPRPQ